MRVVLSIGSNLGDRRGRLQAVIDDLGDSLRAASPVYETDAWGGIEQDLFLNAVVIAEDARLDARGWLRRAKGLERANDREHTVKWGPRTLDVDLICGRDDAGEVICNDVDLMLPHPFAHQRAFVLIPWLDVEPGAELTVDGRSVPVRTLLDGLPTSERAGVRPSALTLDTGGLDAIAEKFAPGGTAR